MSVQDTKMDRFGGTARKKFTGHFITAIDQTALVARQVQVPHPFTVDGVAVYASAVTDNADAQVGILRPGKVRQGVTMVIGTTTTKFKLSVAFDAIMPTRVSGEAMPRVVHQAVTDNIAFSSAFTINVAGAAGVHWGACRVQRDVAGNISTKVVAQDQAFNTEAEAEYACPAADETMLDLGFITIEMASTFTFTAKTTALTGGHVTAVNYNGVTAGFVNVCDADPVFVAGEFVRAVMAGGVPDRAVGVVGGLLIIAYTTDGAGALTNGEVDVDYRPWPLSGEANLSTG